MAREYYSAILEPAQDGWGVTFPSFPGCVSWGHTQRAAALNAEEALQLHVDGMSEEGLDIPYEGEPDQPTLHASGGTVGYSVPIWVPVTLPDGGERVNVYLPKSLLVSVDAYADQAKMNRSSVFSSAVRRYLQSEQHISVADREVAVDLGQLAAAIQSANDRIASLPYSVRFSVERGYQDLLIARGQKTVGMRVSGATTGRLVRDVVAKPEESFAYIFGFLQASLDGGPAPFQVNAQFSDHTSAGGCRSAAEAHQLGEEFFSRSASSVVIVHAGRSYNLQQLRAAIDTGELK